MVTQTPSSGSVLLAPSHFKRLFASPDIGMLSLDASGCILGANHFLSSLLLYSEDELKGRRLDKPNVPAAHRKQQKGEILLTSSDGVRMHFSTRPLGRLGHESELIECEFKNLEMSDSDPVDTIFSHEGSNPALLHPHQLRQVATRELENTRNSGRPFSMLSIGIDRIDSAQAGEPAFAPLALRGFAKVCADLLRATDSVARDGDTSFIALLPGVPSKGAQSAAERLRTAVASMGVPTARGRSRRITVSIGVVSTRTGRSSYSALRSRAEAKRENAKGSGGNRVNA